MTVKCGFCGKDIVVDDGLADGQQVHCPYCGEKSKIRKPTRVELPTGLAGGLQNSRTPKESDPDEVPELPAYKRNPKLRLIRPGTGSAGSGGERTNSLVEQVEARAKAEARKKMRQKLKKLFSNFISIVILAVLAVIGFKVYKSWKGGSTLTEVIDRVKTPEVQPAPRQDEPKEVDQSKTEKEQMVQEMDPNKVALSAVQAKFSGRPVSYWGKLPKNERPGMVNGIFHLFVPRRNGGGNYYELQSATSNAVTLTQLTGSAFSPKSGYEDYVKLMTANGGFLLKDGIAYLITPSGSKKTYQTPSRKGDVFDPAKAVFGEAYGAAKGMDTSNLCFDVYFSLDEKDEAQKIATVKFGQTIPYEEFAKAAKCIAEENKRKSAPSQLKVKKFNQTVVLYDGAHIARGMNGVTKVPRKRPNNRNYKEWFDWPDLYDQALRQENEARRVAEDAQRARKAWKEKINGPASEGEIQKVLLAGMVTVQRN